MAPRIVNLIAVLIVGYTLTTFTAYQHLSSESEETHGGDEKANSVHHYLKGGGRGGRERTLATAFTNITSRIAKAAPASQPERTALRPKRVAVTPVKHFSLHAATNATSSKKAAPASLPARTARRPKTAAAKPAKLSRRFPAFGTEAFTHLCPWTSDALPPRKPNCTFTMHPRASNGEGIAAWITYIVMEHLLARQGGCRILFDYGPSVDISSVIVPWQGLSPSHKDQRNNWTIPSGFKCDRSANCFKVDGNPSLLAGAPGKGGPLGGNHLADVPNYRYPFVNVKDRGFKKGAFEDLKHALRGFNLEIGMACSAGMLFHLSPSASQFETRLFDTILPKLRDDKTLVLSLYIRTGYTDILAAKGVAEDRIDRGKEKRRYEENVDCAHSLEEELLSPSVAAAYSRVVWLVISDSTAAKELVKKEYSGKRVKAPTKADRSRTIPRNVIYTSSHGAHTRPKRGPSTDDFASALLDWFLIGESDVVVTTGSIFSFGVTAALRTARPLYSAKARNHTCGIGASECVCSKHFDALSLLGPKHKY